MPQADDLIGQRERRLTKLKQLRKLGIDPYPAHSKKDIDNQTVSKEFNKYKGKTLSLTGRITCWREHGKMVFANINDQSGKIQLWLKQDEIKGDLKQGLLDWNNLSLLDQGDFVEVQGKVCQTSRGEVSLKVKSLRLLSKSLRPIPQVLRDKEQLLRRRYLDLNIHENKRELFIRKAKFWEVNKEFLKSKGFLEVETPILEHVTGGADAKPFVTHHEALDEDFYLRISTELFQKRLIGAGFEKIFTFGPNFRNEGISEEHLQEYYQIEWYWAYADYRDNMKLVRDLFIEIAKQVFDKTKFTSNNHSFELDKKWKEIDYTNAIKDKFNLDIFKVRESEMIKVLKEQGIDLKGQINRNRLVDNLWKLIRKEEAGPAFLVNTPKFISPLSKSKPDNPELTERFQVIIAGSELGNGYTEINDPQDQLERFLAQQKLREAGDDEAQMLDLDYVEMLEYGMPPVSGYGQSERIFWVLEGINAREGTLFPQFCFELDQNTRKIYGESVTRFTKKSKA